MGNCNKVSKKDFKLLEFDRFEAGKNLKFIVKISKLKLRSLIDPKLEKINKISVFFQFPGFSHKFSEKQSENNIFRWEESLNFYFELPLIDLNSSILNITATSNNDTICSTTVNLKQMIDGPIHQNRSMVLNGKQLARVSFDIEILQESQISITAHSLSCDLEEDNLGYFSISLKFMSDISQESTHSPISENPYWDFETTEMPTLDLPVTMKNIRDAALQVRLYKHHKNKLELAAECWISFTKLFAHDMSTIYRKGNTIEAKSTKEGKNFDFLRIKEEIYKKHLKKINESLWLCGRKVGVVQGHINISGMPTFAQLISGVNTENGVIIQNINIVEQKTKKKDDKLPEEILRIDQLALELKNSIADKNQVTGPAREREIFTKKKEIIDSLCKILTETSRESIMSFSYTSFKSLLKSQKILIELSNHLIEYAPLVHYNIKSLYFKCITKVINRGELDIGYLSVIHSKKEKIKEKSKVAIKYCTMLNEVLKLALSRMNIKGVDKLTQEFIDKSLVLCWFRIPQFRENMKELVKKKSYYEIPEWKNMESNFEEENCHQIVNPLNWNSFYKLIPKDYENSDIIAVLNQDAWRAKIEKRGIAFFSFFEEWIQHAHKQSAAQHFIWSNISEYKVLLKVFLIELKERKIIEYPEALVTCACKLLYNPKMLNVLVKILFAKTNVYEFNTVQETFRVLNRLFFEYFKLYNKLHSTFDEAFFAEGIKICLKNDNSIINSNCLWFIYNNFQLFTNYLKKEVIYDIITKKGFKRLFFHWSKDLRNVFYHLILYRLFSKQNYDIEEENSETMKKISSTLKFKIKNTPKEKLKTEKPYYETALLEYETIKSEYKSWKKDLPTSSEKLFNSSDTFPYPTVTLKLNFLDLSERKLEEQW